LEESGALRQLNCCTACSCRASSCSALFQHRQQLALLWESPCGTAQALKARQVSCCVVLRVTGLGCDCVRWQACVVGVGCDRQQCAEHVHLKKVAPTHNIPCWGVLPRVRSLGRDSHRTGKREREGDRAMLHAAAPDDTHQHAAGDSSGWYLGPKPARNCFLQSSWRAVHMHDRHAHSIGVGRVLQATTRGSSTPNGA
jgi:hypothetical protein